MEKQEFFRVFVEKQEYFPVKVWCWAGQYAPHEMLFYLPDKKIPAGHTCPNCLMKIELDGIHTWDLAKLMWGDNHAGKEL